MKTIDNITNRITLYMLNIIRQILPHGNAATIVNWKRITNNVQLRLDVQRQRYILAPNTQSNAVRLIRALMLNVDLKYMLTLTDGIDLYATGVAPQIPVLRSLFDQVYQGKEAKDVFISDSNGMVVPELLVSTMHDNPMRTLPLDLPWKHWETMRPVQILYHDSLELPWDLGSSQFYFKSEPPHYMITSIDTAVLLIKLIKYIREVKHGSFCVDTIDSFIHHHVLPTLYDDMFRIWEMNVLNGALLPEKRKALLSTTETVNNQLGLANFNDGLDDVDMVLNKLSHYEVTSADFLATGWLSGHSIFQWMQHLSAKVVIPDLRQYMPLVFLRDLPLITMVIRLANCCPEAQASAQLKLYLSRKMDQFALWNIDSHVRTSSLKFELRRVIEELDTALDR